MISVKEKNYTLSLLVIGKEHADTMLEEYGDIYFGPP